MNPGEPTTLSGSGIRRAFVTGANGFIGSALTFKLLEQGSEVRALCRDARKGAHLVGAEVVQGDVQDADRVRALVPGCDVVYHVAAAFNGTAAVHYRANVTGSVNVAQAAHDGGVQRFVHVSSVAVYGLEISGAITEDSPQRPSPRDFYQQSKQIGEAEVWAFARRSGLPVTVVRPSFVYGAGSGFWTRGLYELVRRLPFVPAFPGMAHPIYIADLVDMMLVQSVHPAAVGQAFNCTPDPAIPWTEFLGSYARMAGKDNAINIPTAALSPFMQPFDLWTRIMGDPQDISGIFRYVASQAVYRMDKARTLLGWSPRVTLSQGMAACEAWLKDDPRS